MHWAEIIGNYWAIWRSWLTLKSLKNAMPMLSKHVSKQNARTHDPTQLRSPLEAAHQQAGGHVLLVKAVLPVVYAKALTLVLG